MINLLIKSTLAGLLISIAGYIYIAAGGGITGAFLFSIGLISILKLNLKLFTGYIGFIKSKSDMATGIQILFGNVIGTIIGALTLQPASPILASLVATKLAASLPEVFIMAFYCGFFVHSSVFLYRRDNQIWDVIIGVVAFILLGGEHCIADLYYFIAARAITPYSILFIIVAILGNSLGALSIEREICEK